MRREHRGVEKIGATACRLVAQFLSRGRCEATSLYCSERRGNKPWVKSDDYRDLFNQGHRSLQGARVRVPELNDGSS